MSQSTSEVMEISKLTIGRMILHNQEKTLTCGTDTIKKIGFGSFTPQIQSFMLLNSDICYIDDSYEAIQLKF